jgi:AcrR family transcriptional regulator
MRCALELIEEKGYEPTTVDEIVERADFSRSTFFRYFSTKEDVLLGPREQRIARLAEILEGIDRTLSPTDAFSIVRQLLTQHTLEVTEFAPELESACMRVAQSELLPGYAVGLLRSEQIVAKFLSKHGIPGPFKDFEARIMATAMMGVVRATLTSYLNDQQGVATRLKHGFDMLESRFQQTLDVANRDRSG